MALYVQTNVASMVAQNKVGQTQNALQTTFARLASGYRINSAADDAAGLGISKSMNAQVKSYAVAERNANDAISMVQTADGAAEQVHSILTRMREVAVQASNGGLSTSDYSNLDTEFQSSLSEIDRISGSATYNGKTLLSGAATSTNFQVGIGTATTDRIAVSFGGGDSTRLGVNGLDVTNFTNSQASITALDTAIQGLSTVREGFGAAMNRMGYAVTNLQTMQTNLGASLGRIRDVDFAAETANMSKQQVLAQAGVAVLSQANQSPQTALSLLR